MPASPQTTRWSSLSIALHWLTVLLLVVGVGAVWWRELIEARGERALLLDLHRWAGLAIVLLSGIRLSWRLIGPPRPDAPGTRRTRLVAGAVHAAIYLALLAVPLLGWWLGEARGLSWQLFGFTLPHWIPADPDRADELESDHAAAAWLLLGLAAAHIAAAAWHQFVKRDGLLRAMSWRSPAP